jgi:putative DNA primase/helicase
MTASTFPAELTAIPHWVVAGPDKIPHDAKTGRRASPTDPSTWTDFATARAAADRRGWHVGFVLSEGTGIVAVDLDRCRDPETGTLDPWAAAIIARLNSYTEASVSGTGVHSYAWGTLPPGGRKRGPLEMYDDGRFIIVTGRQLTETAAIEERSDELATLHRETFGNAATPTHRVTASTPATDDDTALLARAFAARNGHRVRLLFDGDTSAHGDDDSAADLALVSSLCYWTGDDDQVDRLFRQSGLYRAKWDRADYRQRTLAKARSTQPGPLPASTATRPNPQDARLVGDADSGRPNTQDAGLLTDAGANPQDARLLARLAALERRVADLETENARLRADNQRLSLLQSKTMAAFRSKHFGAEKATGIAIAFELANQQAAHPDRTEYVIPYARVADQAGLSTSTVGTHVTEKLDPLDLWERTTRVVQVERVDVATGEVTREPKNQTVFVPKLDPLAMLDVLATARPVSGKSKNGHGGARTACPDHPDAGTVKRWSVHCAACDRLLEAGAEHHAVSSKANRQDAGLVAVGDGAPPEPAVAYPSVETVRRDPNERTCHNDHRPLGKPLAPDASERGAAARADLLARKERRSAPSVARDEPPRRAVPLPGMTPEPSPVDQWTG